MEIFLTDLHTILSNYVATSVFALFNSFWMNFQPLHNEVKSVLGIKESYSKMLKLSQIVSVSLPFGQPVHIFLILPNRADKKIEIICRRMCWRRNITEENGLEVGWGGGGDFF